MKIIHKNYKYNERIYSIDYYAYNSKIKNWNSTFKVIFSILILLISIFFNNPFVSIVIILSMMYITVIMGGISLKIYLSLMSILITFVIMGNIAIIFGISSKPIGQYNFNIYFFYIYTSNESIKASLFIILKAFSAISTTYMLTFSTTADEIINVLKKFHIPKLIIELMNLTYRYIFILIDVYFKMHNSAKSRLGYCDFKTAYYSFSNIASNLFIISIKKANEYYNALESRCYDNEILFFEEEKEVTIKQIVLASLFILFIIFIYILTECAIL